MYHYNPSTALEELTEDATLPNPVHVRDMMLRHKLSADQSLELNFLAGGCFEIVYPIGWRSSECLMCAARSSSIGVRSYSHDTIRAGSSREAMSGPLPRSQ
jgi:hypothetical protein